MGLIEIIFIIVPMVLIIGAIITLRQSAKKFNLSDEQLEKVEKRKKEQAIKDKEK